MNMTTRTGLGPAQAQIHRRGRSALCAVQTLSLIHIYMGRVIGKQGRIAKAIRVVMRAAAVRVDEKVLVEID